MIRCSESWLLQSSGKGSAGGNEGFCGIRITGETVCALRLSPLAAVFFGLREVDFEMHDGLSE